MTDAATSELLKHAGDRLVGRAFKRHEGEKIPGGVFKFRGAGAVAVWVRLPEMGGPFGVLGVTHPAAPGNFKPGSEVLCSIDPDGRLTIPKGAGTEWTRKESFEDVSSEEPEAGASFNVDADFPYFAEKIHSQACLHMVV